MPAENLVFKLNLHLINLANYIFYLLFPYYANYFLIYIKIYKTKQLAIILKKISYY